MRWSSITVVSLTPNEEGLTTELLLCLRSCRRLDPTPDWHLLGHEVELLRRKHHLHGHVPCWVHCKEWVRGRRDMLTSHDIIHTWLDMSQWLSRPTTCRRPFGKHYIARRGCCFDGCCWWSNNAICVFVVGDGIADGTVRDWNFVGPTHAAIAPVIKRAWCNGFLPLLFFHPVLSKKSLAVVIRQRASLWKRDDGISCILRKLVDVCQLTVIHEAGLVCPVAWYIIAVFHRIICHCNFVPDFDIVPGCTQQIDIVA